jgi:two-component system, sensor histidine kinase and response regulator
VRPTGWAWPTVTSATVLVVLTVLYAIDPTHGAGVLAYPMVLLPPAVAWIGTMRKPRGERLVPALLTAGLAASALGDLAWILSFHWTGEELDTSPVDLIYITGYVSLGAALLVVTTVRLTGSGSTSTR